MIFLMLSIDSCYNAIVSAAQCPCTCALELRQITNYSRVLLDLKFPYSTYNGHLSTTATYPVPHGDLCRGGSGADPGFLGGRAPLRNYHFPI